MFYVLKVKAIFIPVIMLMIQFVVGGQPAFLRAGTGFVAAHLYLFLDTLYPSFPGGRRFASIIDPPRFFYALFADPAGRAGSSGGANVAGFGYGSVVNSRPAAAAADAAAAPATTTGFGRFAFSSPFKGKGQRLGG